MRGGGDAASIRCAGVGLSVGGLLGRTTLTHTVAALGGNTLKGCVAWLARTRCAGRRAEGAAGAPAAHWHSFRARPAVSRDHVPPKVLPPFVLYRTHARQRRPRAHARRRASPAAPPHGRGARPAPPRRPQWPPPAGARSARAKLMLTISSSTACSTSRSRRGARGEEGGGGGRAVLSDADCPFPSPPPDRPGRRPPALVLRLRRRPTCRARGGRRLLRRRRRQRRPAGARALVGLAQTRPGPGA